MYITKKNNQAFTLIELLLVIFIIGVLSSIIFVSIGNQRQNARVSAALQIAEGALAIGHECNFRLGGVDFPNDAKTPTNNICAGSHAPWSPVNVDGCEYTTLNGNGTAYEITCVDAGKKVVCGVAQTNAGCEIVDIP